MPNALNIAGERYGLLTAVRRSGTRRFPSGNARSLWIFRCACGAEVEKTLFDVRRLDTKSCGCGRKGKPSPNRLSGGGSSLNALYAGYVRASKDRGHSWNVSKEEFQVLTKRDCHYCGVPPSRVKKAHKSAYGVYEYNGIDRVDPSIGYELSNLVPCCWLCNRAKATLTVEEFINWAARLSAYLARTGRI